MNIEQMYFFGDELEKLAAPISARELRLAAGRLKSGTRTLRGAAKGAIAAAAPTPRQARSWGDKPNPLASLMSDDSPVVRAFVQQVAPGEIGVAPVSTFRQMGPAHFGRKISKREAQTNRHFALLHEAQERKVRNPTYDVPHTGTRILLDEKPMRMALSRRRGSLKEVGDMMERMRVGTGEEKLVLDKLRGIDPRLVGLYEKGQLRGAARRFVERKLRGAGPITPQQVSDYGEKGRKFFGGNVMNERLSRPSKTVKIPKTRTTTTTTRSPEESAEFFRRRRK